MKPSGPFHMEAAGSLTPELEGGVKSGTHERRIQSKVRKTGKKNAGK